MSDAMNREATEQRAESIRLAEGGSIVTRPGDQIIINAPATNISVTLGGESWIIPGSTYARLRRLERAVLAYVERVETEGGDPPGAWPALLLVAEEARQAVKNGR